MALWLHFARLMLDYIELTTAGNCFANVGNDFNLTDKNQQQYLLVVRVLHYKPHLTYCSSLPQIAAIRTMFSSYCGKMIAVSEYLLFQRGVSLMLSWCYLQLTISST